MRRLEERSEIHVDPFLGNVEELKHEEQIVFANVADAD